MSSILDGLKVEGFVTVVKNGEEILSQKNLITDAGRDWIIQRLLRGSYKYEYFSAHYMLTELKHEANPELTPHPSTTPELFLRRYDATNFPDHSADLVRHGKEITNIERVYLGTGTTEPAVTDTFVETEATWNSYIELYKGNTHYSWQRGDGSSANVYERLTNIGIETPCTDSGFTRIGWEQKDEAYYKISKYAGPTSNSSDYQTISTTDQVFRFHLNVITEDDKHTIFPYNFYTSLDAIDAGVPISGSFAPDSGIERTIGFSNLAYTGTGDDVTYSEKDANPLFGSMPHLEIASRDDSVTKTEIVKLLQVQFGGSTPAYMVCLRGQQGTTAQTWTQDDQPYVRVVPEPNIPSDMVHRFVYRRTNSISGNTNVPSNDEPITEAALCFHEKELTGEDWTNPVTTDTTKNWKAFSRIKFNQPWTRSNRDDIEIFWTIRIT